MAKICDINLDEWNEWVSQRPAIIKNMCILYPQNILYRLKPTGDRVMIYSYSEDGTVTVSVTGKYNFLVFERNVFGINPDNLEECDLPADDEKLGVVLTEESEIKEYIEATITHHVN